MKSLASFFSRPKVLMAFSLLASVIIWLCMSILYSPSYDRVVSDVPIEIPLSTSTRTNYLTAFSGTDVKINVTVTGKKYIVEQLNSDSFNIVANIDSINGVGEYSLDLSAQKASDGDFTIKSIYPEHVNVYVDVEKEVTFSNVEINCVGASIDKGTDLTQSLLLEPEFITKDNSTIKIKGPDKEIKRIKSVKAVADVNAKLTESTKYTARIEMYDANGNVLYNSLSDYNELKYVEPTITSADIMANVFLRKTVPLKYKVENGPATLPEIKIYEVTGSDTSKDAISTISIKGEPDKVRDVSEITLDNSINFAEYNLSDKYSYKGKLTLPVIEGVTYDEYAKLNDVYFVAVPDVNDYAQKTLDVAANKIVLKNLPEGVKASVKTALNGITVVGKTKENNNISADDISVTVDCSNLTSGTTITPVITVSSSYPTCWISGTYQVTVDVTS